LSMRRLVGSRASAIGKAFANAGFAGLCVTIRRAGAAKRNPPSFEAAATVAGYAPLHPPYGRRAASIACQMRWLVVGMSGMSEFG